MTTSSTNLASVQSMLSKARKRYKELLDQYGQSHYYTMEAKQKVQELEEKVEQLKNQHLPYWTCKACGYSYNHSNSVACADCGKPKGYVKPAQQQTGWNCGKCGAHNFAHENTCYSCGTNKKGEPAAPPPEPMPSYSKADVEVSHKLYEAMQSTQKPQPTQTLHNVHVNLSVVGLDQTVVFSLVKALLTSLQSAHPDTLKGFSLDGISWTDKYGDWFAEVDVDGKLQQKEKQVELGSESEKSPY